MSCERSESSELGHWERCISGVRWQGGKGGKIVRWHGRRDGNVIRWQFGKGGRVVSRWDGGIVGWNLRTESGCVAPVFAPDLCAIHISRTGYTNMMAVM